MPNTIIKQYYNDIGQRYGVNSLRKKKIIGLATEDDLENKRILDIGCASGIIGADIKRVNNTVIGIDMSDKFVSQAKKVIDHAYALDIENDELPKEFIERQFDIIIAAEIIEHLFDQENFLKKVRAMLKPGGKFIITSPNFLVWNNRLKMLFGRFGKTEVFNDKSHIHLLSYNGLKLLLMNAGFHVVKENHVWYPNWLEKFHSFLPPNLFVYQSILKLQ